VSYTVLWTREAEQELAAIWMSAADRATITEAARFLDCALIRNPSSVGESRPKAQRIAYCLPLGIRFQVFEPDRLVKVVSVWTAPRLGK
jgi:hypothetical protein